MGTAALVAVIGALGACGGGDSKTGAEVAACLKGNVPDGMTFTDVQDELDLLSEAAGDKGMAVTSDKQEINVAVERSDDDAKATKERYDMFFDAFAAGGKVERHGNVVVAYNKTPTDVEQQAVKPCVE